MSEYSDYGYATNMPCHVEQYVWQKLFSLLKNQHNGPILDLGCGNGSLAAALIARGYDAYGTDASEAGIRIAAEKFPDRFFVQDLSKDALPVPLQHIRFQTIISTEVIEHLYDPAGMIAFARRILENAPQGRFIITTPYHGYLKNLILSLTGKWDQHADPLWKGGHIKLWSRKTLTQLLANEGFRVTHFVGCGRVPFVWKSMLLVAQTA